MFMPPVLLGAVLLASAAFLASTPAVLAQEIGYPGSAASTGADSEAERAAAAWTCYGATPSTSASINGPTACNTTPGCGGYSGTVVGRCGGSAAGYLRCPSPYASYGESPHERTLGYTRYTSSQGSPFFAPGGEAYSYAGYGGFSPLGSGVGTSTRYGVDGTSLSAAASDLFACASAPDGHPVSRPPASTAGDDLNGTSSSG
jgi:hypothetical protein